jgi:hypothetical protein
MKSSIVLIFLAITNTTAWAQPKEKIEAHPNVALRQTMNAISGSIRDLGPYIASEQEFIKEKNNNHIQKSLSTLNNLFKNLKEHPVINTKGLLLNQSVMSDQLDQTVTLFKNKKKFAARAKFTASLNLCISCHAQSPGLELTKLFHDKDISKMKLSIFEQAELYFISRDYEKAMALYDQYLSNSKKSDDDELILKALERELIYFIRIKKNFQEAKIQFDKYLNAKNFNESITEEVTQWNVALSGKSLWEGFNAEQTKNEQMEKFMKGFILDDEEGPIFTVSNSSEVYDLNLSTILLDFYNAHPETSLGPKILYWLAILDKRVNDDLFFSIADLYLLSCMEKYSKDPVALDCYDAYEEDLSINYIRKNKKEFPSEIINRLNNLKKLINYTDVK